MQTGQPLELMRDTTGSHKPSIRSGQKYPLLLLLLMTTTLAAPSAHLSPANAQTVPAPASAEPISYDIPAQPLSRALVAFSKGTGSELFFDATLVREKTSPGARGRLTKEEALARILAGAGLSYRISGNAVIISEANAAVEGTLGADGSLLLNTIDVNSMGSAADRPFETPGSTSYISGQELERFPGLTAGSMFQGTPGVISGSSNNGAAIDPNIRGLQGMNRVATTIDGSQQSTSTYRGYAGVDNRTYVDPDLISGITVTKGPDGSVGGAIGGTIAMETLGVADILKPGDTYGVRARVGLNSNGVAPVIDQTGPSYGQSDTGNWTGSLAAAVTTPGVDLVAAYARRNSGNYFSGTRGDLTTADYEGVQQKLSNYGYGQQIYNTSEDVTSGLLKATLRPADGHEFQFGYLYYGNEFGEVSPSAIATTTGVTWQLPLSSVQVNQLTARYHFKPDDNDLVDFKINSYLSNVDETNVFALLGSSSTLQQQSKNFGVSATNVSRLSVFGTPLALEYGGSYTYERAIPSAAPTFVSGGPLWAMPADGERQVSTLTATAKWEPLFWLAVQGGLQYINYETTFLGTEQYGYEGPDFTGYSGSGVSPSASVTVTPLPGWQLYAQYQSGIRPLSVRETSQTRFEQVFNPDLEAEEASNWEFGTNFLKTDWLLPGDKARLKVAYFENKTNNYVGRSYQDSDMIFFNYDYVRFKGIEISGGYDAGWGFFDFGFNYYTGFESCLKNGPCQAYTLQADYLTNQIPPDFTASVTAGMRFWDDRITVGGRLTYMGQRLAPLVEDASYFWVTKLWAPYTIVDLFGQWKINDTLTLDVGVQNLFDAYYVDALNNTDMPAPGRVIRGSLTAKLGGSEPVMWLPFGQPASARNMPWTGLYVGGHFGYGFGQINGTTTPGNGTANAIAASESADQNPSSMLGGAQAGFNYQFSNGFVVGVEADYSWMHMADYRNAFATEGQELIDNHQLQARTDYSFDWLATIRGRVGYAWDRLFIYGTGGVAFLKETETRTQYRSSAATESLPAWRTTDTFFVESASATRTGFAVGGGAEYAFANNWSLKLEYLFTGFGATDFLFGNARAGVTKSYTVTTRCTRSNTTPPCRGVRENVNTTYLGTSETVNGREASNDAELQMLKVGLNYRF